MSFKAGSTLTLVPAFVVAFCAVSAAAPANAPASGARHSAVAVHRVHRPYSAHRWHQFARRARPPGYYGNIPPDAIVGTGYVFVPGVGILDESCDLPTSACPNSERDIQ